MRRSIETIRSSLLLFRVLRRIFSPVLLGENSKEVEKAVQCKRGDEMYANPLLDAQGNE